MTSEIRTKIFIVMGYTDEFESAAEWVVEVYVKRERAEARVAALTAILVEHGATRTSYPNYIVFNMLESMQLAIRNAPGGDPKCLVYDHGTRYDIEEGWLVCEGPS